MSSGVIHLLLACLCWGLVFALPAVIHGFNPVEIALGRFLVYGLISSSFLIVSKRYLLSKRYWSEWLKAGWFGLLSTLLCYGGMVFCMRFANPAVTVLIYAISPITIALLGNYRKKEFAFKHLLLPSLFMFVGILLVNWRALCFSDASFGLYFLGLLCGFGGLVSWTWYAVANSEFFSNQPKVTVNDWSVMMGSATLVLVLFLSALLLPFSHDVAKFIDFDSQMQVYVIASVVMGVFSTWLAFLFWNLGSKRLPISIVGQLMIFEVIFGLILIYIVEERLPVFLEALGIGAMLLGVVSGYRKLTKVSASNVHAA